MESKAGVIDTSASLLAHQRSEVDRKPVLLNALASVTTKISAETLMSAAILIASFIAYFLTANQYLEDYDSINFALAVKDFDLTLAAPHPPGAPVFIALVKVVHYFVGHIPTSLSLVAALGGAVFVAAWYRLYRFVLTPSTSLIASIILAFAPGLWITASRPMSDTLAAAALSLFMVLVLNARRDGSTSARGLIAASAMLAIMVGIRPQFGLLAPLLLIGTLLYFRPALKTAFWVLCSFAVVNLLWLVPTVISQYDLDGHGWMTYFNQIIEFKASFGSASGSPLLADNVNIVDVLIRLATHIGALGYFALGMNMWYPESIGHVLQKFGTTLNPWSVDYVEWTIPGTLYTLFYVFGALALLPRIRYYWRKAQVASETIGYLLLVAIAYTLVVVLLVPPHTRFYIPLLPFFVLLPMLGLQSRRYGNRVQFVLMALAIAAAAPTLNAALNDDAPPIALVKDIKQLSTEAGAGTVLLLNANAARHAQWYLPAADIYGGHEKQAPADPDEVFKSGDRVFSNYPDAFPASAVSVHKVHSYHRPYRVWMRHTSNTLYELKRRSPLPVIAVQPATTLHTAFSTAEPNTDFSSSAAHVVSTVRIAALPAKEIL